jgi:hypothetical protein
MKSTSENKNPIINPLLVGFWSVLTDGMERETRAINRCNFCKNLPVLGSHNVSVRARQCSAVKSC